MRKTPTGVLEHFTVHLGTQDRKSSQKERKGSRGGKYLVRCRGHRGFSFFLMVILDTSVALFFGTEVCRPWRGMLPRALALYTHNID